jgi:hypothetical protein
MFEPIVVVVLNPSEFKQTDGCKYPSAVHLKVPTILA